MKEEILFRSCVNKTESFVGQTLDSTFSHLTQIQKNEIVVFAFFKVISGRPPRNENFNTASRAVTNLLKPRLGYFFKNVTATSTQKPPLNAFFMQFTVRSYQDQPDRYFNVGS